MKQRGSATIEAVGSIAALAMFFAVILQVVLVAEVYLTIGYATREGARAAALGEGDTAVKSLVAELSGVHPGDVGVNPGGSRVAGELITVAASADVARLPVLAAILPALEVSADATARVEVST